MNTQAIESAIIEHLTAQRERIARGHQIHQAIGGVVSAWEGKALTKRFTDKVTEAVTPILSGYHAFHYPHPGRLELWNNRDIPFNSRWTFYIAGYSLPVSKRVTREEFESQDAGHGASAVEALAQIDDYLHPDTPILARVSEKVDTYLKAKAALDEELDAGFNSVRWYVQDLVKKG
jgi:hypothetical protein